MKPKFVSFIAITLPILVGGSAMWVRGETSRTAPRRIVSRLMDLGEVHKIFLAQGLAAVVQLPYPISEVKVGSPDSIHVQISKTLPSELTLILKAATAKPTNLIVRCGLRSFVFDLVPSKRTHQDLVRISGAYGGPSSEDVGAVLIDSSGGPHSAPAAEDMVLIDSSEGRAKGVWK